jgi:hypothetical protein
MRYSVTQADAERALALVPLWAANLPIESDPYEKYRWYYLDNPSGRGEALMLQCEEQSTVRCVGAEGIGVRTVHVNGAPVRVGLLADLAVETPHRTVLPALTLLRAVCAHCRDTYVFAYGFPNEHAVGVFARAGYRRLGKMTRYVLVLRHAPYVAKWVKSDALSWAAGLALDGPPHLRRAMRTLGHFRSLRLTWSTTIDERFDALWAACRNVAPIVGQRDAAHIRWRFFERPGASVPFRIATLEDEDSPLLRGYAVVERTESAVHVRDILARTPADTHALLDRLAFAARREGASSLSVRTLGETSLAELLVEHGFSPRESTRAMMIDVARTASSDAMKIVEARRWYVTDGDEDT